MAGSVRHPRQPISVQCAVAACGWARASAAEVAAWRKNPVPPGMPGLPASLLKHADEQTIVSLRAVYLAMQQVGWSPDALAGWGVVAAPDLLGRISVAQTIVRYQTEGAWGISPHLIPQHSLHAVSGTISQALGLQGPNFGAGGSGPCDGSEGLMLAATLLADDALPGLWVLLSGFQHEYLPAAPGQAQPPPPPCAAVALALTRNARQPLASLTLAACGPGADHMPFSLTALIEQLEHAGRLRTSGWALGCFGTLDVEARP